MWEADSQRGAGPDEDRPAGRRVSRRDFLKIAGVAGAGAGLGGGLAALLGSCSGRAATTTTAGAPTTTSAAVTSTTVAEEAPTTTAVSAGVEEGAEFKAGYVLPMTGAMADFGTAAIWQIDWFTKNLWKDGLLMGDGKRHKFTVVVKDM